MKLCFASIAILFSTAAFAAESGSISPPMSSQTLSQVAPSEAGAAKFSLGLGTGFNSYGGNMGQLYSTSSPVAELRAGVAFSSMFSAHLGGEFAGYSLNAAPVGSVNVATRALAGAVECHYLNTAFVGSGFDPYVMAGGGQLWRTQSFQDFNDVEKDNASFVNAGLGTNYNFANSKVGLWLEAAASQVFYQDRFSQEFLPSGIENMTGLLYGARVGAKYVF